MLRLTRFATAAVLTVSVLLVALPAEAATITYDYTAEVTDCPFGDPAGPCGTAAAPGPIVVGSMIAGFLEIDSAAVAGGAAGAADVVDFFFDVAGIFALSPAGGQSVGAGTNLIFDAASDLIGGVFELVLPGLAGPGIDGLLINEFGDDGSGKWQIVIPAFGNAFVNGGVARVSRSVPEPSSLALLVIGLGAIAVRRRRARAVG